MTQPLHIRAAQEHVQRNGAGQQAPSQGGDASEHPLDRPNEAKPDPARAPTDELGVTLDRVTPERVEWLWEGRIPLGKLTILDGDPGLGKSTVTMDLAARLSAGRCMPDGSTGAPAGVILLNAEDGLADTVVPRLIAAGGDPARVLALPTVPASEDEGGQRIPSLPFDLHHVRACITRMQAALVIVDPLMAYLDPVVNAHRDQDVRRALHPLSLLAQETGAAVVVVRHLNKQAAGSPLYRGGGSIGIIGAARSGLLVGKDPENEDHRVLASMKCNLAKRPDSMAFELVKAGDGLRIQWLGPSPHTAESLLAAPRDNDEDRGALADAVQVLRQILAGGPKAVSEAKQEARQAGVAARTLSRAKAMLNVQSIKLSFTGPWMWRLPEPKPSEGCQT
jgi:hypothetical protein